jgi:PAS domain S-box-containing protein
LPRPSRSDDVVHEDPDKAHRRLADVVSAVDQAAWPVIVADVLGRVTFANGAATQLIGLPSERIHGRHVSALVARGHQIPLLEPIMSRVAAGHRWSGPVLARREDGVDFDFELAVAPVRDQHGAVRGSVALVGDRRAERALADQLRSELRQQAAVGAALADLDPTEPLGVLCGQVANALLAIDGVDFARVIALGTRDQGEVLADRSRGLGLPRQLRVPPARTRHLRARASEGAWVATWIARREYGAYGKELKAAGVHAAGYAPLRHAGRSLGVLSVGTLDPRGVHVLERHLTALSHFGALASGLLGPALAERQHDAELRAEIEHMISARTFMPVFQPIVRLADHHPIAYEALTRFQDGSPPERRFSDAEAIGLGIEFETATLRMAVDAAEALPGGVPLSVNVSPAYVTGHGAVADLVARSSRPMVLEITEREPIEDYGAFREAVAGLDVAVDWAVDDAGAGYASLRHIIEIRPRFVKLDRGLVADINADPIRQALVMGMLHFANSIGVDIIAEGIETEAQRLTLQGLGVELGQGFLFARPSALRAESGSAFSKDGRDGLPITG